MILPAVKTTELEETAGQIRRETGSVTLVAEPMARYTSIGLGGAADLLVFSHSESALKSLLDFCRVHELPVTIIGDGSNILVSDKGIRGVVIKLTGSFDEVALSQDCLTAGAGVSLSRAITQSANAGLRGLEVVYGVPGSLGGGIYMNAGTKYGWISDNLHQAFIVAMDGSGRWMSPEDLKMSYRHSLLQDTETPSIVTRAEFALKPDSADKIKADIAGMAEARKSSQPLNWRSCGCMFRNPEGDSAGRLIDSCGLKGRKIGGASVSDKHANFIVVDSSATAADVYSLTNIVQKEVLERMGIRLEMEVKLLGDWDH